MDFGRSGPTVHSIPEVYMFRQVSRLGFSLLKPLPIPQGTVGHRSFVRLTVTGIARDFHPVPSAQGPLLITYQNTLFNWL